MKLKTKRLLAAALALSLTANISLAAFAGTYDLAGGSITIDGGDSAEANTTVQVGSNDAVVDNEEITIIQTNSEEATNNTVTIEGNVDNSVTITDVNIEVDENSTNDAAITIEENSTVSDLTINNSTITVDEEGASGIEIGTGSDVNMTLSGDNEIILNEGNTSGIQVGTTDAEEGQDTTVNITIDGTTTIGEGVTTDEEGNTTSNVVNTNTDLTTIANMTGGITVGGGMYDGADGVDSDESGTSTTVTITSSEEGGTLNIGETDTTAGVSTGILVHKGASVIIGDDDEERNLLEVNINGTHRTYANVENNHTNDIFVTVSGNGIAAYGDVTITGNNTEVNIEDTDLRGISMTGADLTISDGATVNIDGVGGDSDNLKQETIEGATHSGTSNTHAGIYSSGASVYIDDATLNVNDVQNANGGTNFGVALDNTGDQEFVISDGATVDISNVTSGTGIGVAGNNLLEIDRSTVTVTGTYDGVYLNNGALLYVHSADENGENVKDATLVVENSTNNAITAYGADVEFIGDQVLVKIKNAANTGIAMGVPKNSETGELTDVDEDGNVNERHLFVKDGAQLEITEVGYVGILVGNENVSNISSNKVIEITGNAYVKISLLGQDTYNVIDGTNSIILWGGNNSLLVDDSTLITENRISMSGSKDNTSKITINNGSRVEATVIRDYGADTTGAGSLIVNGGTLKLTAESTDKRDLSANDAETLQTDYVWPVSGDFNGGEKLTNFQLDAATLQAYQDANQGNLTDAEFLEKYGYVITTEGDSSVNETSKLLVFETYGYSNGKYINYNTAEGSNLSGTEWYVVDLNKYDDTTELWVWTPAVVLSYFELNEGNTLSNAEPSDESDPDKVTVGSSLADYHDVVVRGQSIAFGNFQTDKDYATIKLTDDNGEESTAYAIAKEAAAEKGIVLYIFDAMDDGKATDSLSENDVIIVKGDDDKFYLADEDGNATGDAIGTYYYALVDDEGNFILDDDGNFIWYDEDGVAYTAESDGVALIAVLDSGTSYVLEVDGKYYRVNSNGEYTTVVAGEAIPVGSLWSVFDEYTRVRSNAQANGEDYNFENVFGGKDGAETEIEPEDEPEPEEEEETETTDPEPIVPIDPLEEENGTPGTSDTPASSETPTETPEETPAETPAEPEAPAETPETPASSTPKTGDEANVAIYLVMAALSGAALIGLGVTGKKKNEEV